MVEDQEKTFKWNRRKRCFIAEYLVDFNGTQAAIRAGYSPKTATEQASRLLSNVNIRQEVQNQVEEKLNALGVNAFLVLQELAYVGFSDCRQIFKEDGTLKNLKELDEKAARAIASIEVFEEYAGRGDERRLIGFTKKMKFWPKVPALELLGKKFGIFIEKMEHDIDFPKLAERLTDEQLEAIIGYLERSLVKTSE